MIIKFFDIIRHATRHECVDVTMITNKYVEKQIIKLKKMIRKLKKIIEKTKNMIEKNI